MTDRKVKITVTFTLERPEEALDHDNNVDDFALSAMDAIFEMYGTAWTSDVSATAEDVTVLCTMCARPEGAHDRDRIVMWNGTTPMHRGCLDDLDRYGAD